jgi:hypothetical protein
MRNGISVKQCLDLNPFPFDLSPSPDAPGGWKTVGVAGFGMFGKEIASPRAGG